MRYPIALADTGASLRDIIAKRLPRQAPPVAPGEIHPDLGLIRAGAQSVPMGFGDWNPEGSAERLLATEDWQALHALLTECQHLCRTSGILPVLLYLPTKSQLYAESATAHSGRRFVQAAAEYIWHELQPRLAAGPREHRFEYAAPAGDTRALIA